MAWLLFSAPVQALETDQFYAWGKPIEDSTEFLNAWTRLQVESVLESYSENTGTGCEAVVRKLQKRLQHSIYQPIEVWILSGDLVDRVPKGPEDNRDYRQRYLLSSTFPFDPARWLQPSPTLEVNGIRLGSDKLAHFFSEGWWYYRWWKKNRDKESVEVDGSLVRYGVNLEKWVHGLTLTGIFSPADMEANYQGFVFYHSLCHGDAPLLFRRDGRWHFSASFDLRDYVSPEWDESWNANIYGGLRWKGIRSTMQAYCPMLDSPWVKRQRAYYRELDRQTPVEDGIERLVSEGDLPDPRKFDITTVCSGSPNKE